VIGRATQGVRLQGLESGDRVGAVTSLVADEAEADGNGNGSAPAAPDE
jgi:hypothetical protein